MGWSFRRGKTIGGLRVTFSQRGTGTSVGTRAARLSLGASGRTTLSGPLPDKAGTPGTDNSEALATEYTCPVASRIATSLGGSMMHRRDRATPRLIVPHDRDPSARRPAPSDNQTTSPVR